jgi:hypothetical protein
MSVTNLAEVADQVQKYWAPMFTKELRASLLLGGLVNKSYEGSITRGGDTVRVSQIVKPNGQLLTIGTDADSFQSESVTTLKTDIVANKRAVASYEFEDVVSLQSQISQENPEVMEALRYAMSEQINNYLYSLTAPSASSPDHQLNSVTDFNASQLAAVRLLAAQAKWPKDGQWYCLVDPSFYSDLMNAQTLSSSDFGATDAPTIGGQIALRRFGFNILEDDSRAVDRALIFHPSYLHMVSQTEVQVKISDLHSQKKFGVVMSVDMIFGAKLASDGDKRHITVVAAASGTGT